MTDLIAPLSAAHAALLLKARDTAEAAPLLSTARKIEGTLLAELAAGTEDAKAPCLTSIMNSGSLKALKTFPENARLPEPSWGQARVDSKFVLTQAPSYIREAIKRGFAVDQESRLEFFRRRADETDRHNCLQSEYLVLSGPMTLPFMLQCIKELQSFTPEQRKNIAPFAERLFKACVKANQEQFNSSFALMLGIQDPAAAHEHLYRYIGLYALLGAAKPNAKALVHPDMKRLAEAVASGQGRRALGEDAGGVQGYLAKGFHAPTGIIAEFERKRLSWQRPVRPRSQGWGRRI